MEAVRELKLTDLPGWCDELAARLVNVDLAPLFRRLSLYLVRETRRNFEEQHSPDGVPWAAFVRSPNKRRGGPSAKLLRDRDILFGSLTAGSANHVEEIMSSSLIWGTNVPYGGFHQDGTKNMEARPFVGITLAMTNRIEDITLDYMRERLVA